MSIPKQSTLTIETPEGVVFSYALATPVTRALAWAIDAFVVIGGTMLVAKVLGTFGRLSADWVNALSVLAYLTISIGYGIALEWRWRGQTLGKRVLGLRVIDAQGLRLQVPQIAIRNLLRFADMLPLFYLTGGIAALVTRKCQRLGDLAANTVVAHERKWQQPDLEQIAPARYNSLAAWPNHAARLRSLASPEAVAMAVRALAQRDTYDPSARIDLFADLAAYFRGLVSFPDAALEGLTDEQYLRSVLRVIYGARRS